MGGHPARWGVALLVLLGAIGAVPMKSGAQAAPTPPGQPADGPGGSATPYPEVEARRFGAAPTGFWLFVPTGGERSEAPEALPVVLFLHGFTAVDPRVYGAWVEHIARRGAVVVYPDYQRPGLAGQEPAGYLPNLLTGVRAAVAELASGSVPGADLGRVAVVGHSLGGVLAVNYAAVAARYDVPVPRAVMPVMPGGCAGCGPTGDRLGAPLGAPERIAAGTLVEVVVGADDGVVADTAGREIWSRLALVPAQDRDYVTLRSDRRGRHLLAADHLQPQSAGAGGEVDALDWYGTWKLFDLLTDCAFHGRGCADALGGSAAQRAMGEWSDGTPVTEALVTDDPGPPDP